VTRIITLALTLLLAAQTAAAQTFSAGNLTIGPVWTRATPPGAKTAVGYLRITNKGTEPDRLLRVEFASATEAGLHETAEADGISTMRMVDSISIPAGATVELEPGGLHAMFTGLTGPLQMGDTIAGALVFEKAGRVEVEFGVESIGATSPSE
jgi:hypothetical protein